MSVRVMVVVGLASLGSLVPFVPGALAFGESCEVVTGPMTSHCVFRCNALAQLKVSLNQTLGAVQIMASCGGRSVACVSLDLYGNHLCPETSPLTADSGMGSCLIIPVRPGGQGQGLCESIGGGPGYDRSCSGWVNWTDGWDDHGGDDGGDGLLPRERCYYNCAYPQWLYASYAGYLGRVGTYCAGAYADCETDDNPDQCNAHSGKTAWHEIGVCWAYNDAFGLEYPLDDQGTFSCAASDVELPDNAP